jgi:predicted GIY-YIG superfamily endonuclease
MYYVYFLKSLHHEFYYTGCTGDLKKRLAQHNSGFSRSTKHYAPFELTAYIAVKTSKQASDLEKYFKTGSGKAFLRKRILRYEAL